MWQCTGDAKCLDLILRVMGGPQRQKKYRMIRFYGRSDGKNYQLQNKFWSRELYFKPRE